MRSPTRFTRWTTRTLGALTRATTLLWRWTSVLRLGRPRAAGAESCLLPPRRALTLTPTLARALAPTLTPTPSPTLTPTPTPSLNPHPNQARASSSSRVCGRMRSNLQAAA